MLETAARAERYARRQSRSQKGNTVNRGIRGIHGKSILQWHNKFAYLGYFAV
jgi:hypothetical protein